MPNPGIYHRVINFKRDKALSSSLKLEPFADLFGSRHCTSVGLSGDIHVDLSLFV